MLGARATRCDKRYGREAPELSWSVTQELVDAGLVVVQGQGRNGNARFTKPPKGSFDVHRPVRDDEDLELIFTWRSPRRVTNSLTVQYDRLIA